jgi:hypothetical protein
MLDLSAGRTNAQKSTDGVWVSFAVGRLGYIWWQDSEARPVAEGEPFARALIARAGNLKSRELRKKLLQPYRRFTRNGGELSEEVQDKISREVIANTLLLDWDLVVKDGQPVKYTPEEGVRALEGSEDFQTFVLEVSGTTQLYRDQALREDSELVGKSSPGKSSGAGKSRSSARRASP